MTTAKYQLAGVIVAELSQDKIDVAMSHICTANRSRGKLYTTYSHFLN